ncbi:MAG TPA: hypothetical protein PL070_19830, partial [Flavobacteriales bacterium]|nr:hypothetical protein [Flavobacteriales bacterium]
KDFVDGAFTLKGVKYRRELLGAIKEGKLLNVKSRQYDEMTQTMADSVVVRTIMEGWSYDRKKAEKLTKPVFTFKGGTFTQKDLLDHLEARQRRERVIPLATYVNERFESAADERIMAYEDANLEDKYSDFRLLMKEYRDGILLFELTDQKVWGKAVRDTAGLEAFHAAHKTDFMWDTRYEGDLYICSDAQVAKQVRNLVGKGKRGAELTTIVNKTNPLALTIETGLFTAEQKSYLKGITKPGIGPDIKFDDRVVLADIKGVRAPEPKTLEEARGLITAAYQDDLEKNWIKELRAKYTVSVDQDVLHSIK